MSAAARKAVAERMRAYWAKRRTAAGRSDGAAETTPEEPAPRKSILSAAGRAAISAAQKKRWAARKRAGKKR
jgi:hypothetical protein